MKKIICRLVSLIIILSFTGCGLLNSEKTNTEEDNMSLYYSNLKLRESELSFIYPLKLQNGDYLIPSENGEMYLLTESEWEESLAKRDLLIVDEYYDFQFNYGKQILDFNNGILPDNAMPNFFQTYQNYLYFLADGKIHKINSQDTSDYKIFGFNDIASFFFYRNEIYYIKLKDNVEIYKSDLNGNESELVINCTDSFKKSAKGEIYNVGIINDYLFFLLRENGNFSNNFLFCKCKTDGSESEIWREEKNATLLYYKNRIITADYDLDEEYDDENEQLELNFEIYSCDSKGKITKANDLTINKMISNTDTDSDNYLDIDDIFELLSGITFIENGRGLEIGNGNILVELDFENCSMNFKEFDDCYITYADSSNRYLYKTTIYYDDEGDLSEAIVYFERF